VLVRLQHSHIRIGTFQRLAYFDETDNIRKLADYCLFRYYAEEPGEDTAARLLGHVTREAARLAASYLAAGFVHGVLNTDNIAITAQSFDYGPWRWTPYWDGAFTAAYFDRTGLYAFGRQPEAIHWNLLQLARTLLPISSPEVLEPLLNEFRAMFQRALRIAICARLGSRARWKTRKRAMRFSSRSRRPVAEDRHDRPFLLRLARRQKARAPRRRCGI
jgi:uncharacterized protein YdiU (UPF0061 family)